MEEVRCELLLRTQSHLFVHVVGAQDKLVHPHGAHAEHLRQEHRDQGRDVLHVTLTNQDEGVQHVVERYEEAEANVHGQRGAERALEEAHDGA